MIDNMIIVAEIADEERRSLVWHLLANAGPDLTTLHCCEIDTTTWDEDAWREWQQQVNMIEDVLDVDEDTVIIWSISGGHVDRQALGCLTYVLTGFEQRSGTGLDMSDRRVHARVRRLVRFPLPGLSQEPAQNALQQP